MDSFDKASSFDIEVNFRSFANLGYTEKSDKSAINQLNGTNSEEMLKNDALDEMRKKNAKHHRCYYLFSLFYFIFFIVIIYLFIFIQVSL